MAAPALAQAFTDAATAAGSLATIFAKPPATLNPPAIVIGRPTEVRYSTIAFAIDDCSLPVLCIGAVDGEDDVAALIDLVRGAITDATLGGAVQTAFPAVERNWRQINVAGADLLQAEVTFSIQM